MSAHNKRNLKEFQRYSSRLNRMIEDGSLEGGGQSRLVSKVRSLYQGLMGIVPEKTLRSILAAGAVVVIGLSTACGDGNKSDTDTATDMTSDTVTDIVGDTDTDMPMDTVPDVDPDGDPDVMPDVDPDGDPDVMPDVDPDGDPDVMPDMDPDADPDVMPDVEPDATDVVDEEVISVTPSFGAIENLPFGLTAGSNYYASIALGDIDDDGDFDLFMAQYGDGVTFYENTGTPTAPAFAAPAADPFGLSSSLYIEGIDLADIDGDGDLDLFSSDYNFSASGLGFVLYENTGTAAAPTFAAGSENPFGLTSPTTDYIFPELVDLDGDGDLDVLSTEGIDLFFHENTGTATAPAFAAPSAANPFGLTPGYYSTAPACTDLDIDGDQDVLLGYYGYPTAGMDYFENNGASTPVMTGPTAMPFGLTTPYVYVMPEFADLDNDGDDDLLVAELWSNLVYFENTTF